MKIKLYVLKNWLLLVIIFHCFGQLKAQVVNNQWEWHFNSCDGSTLIESVNGLNGAVAGATWTEGYNEQGLYFDGVDDYATIPDDLVNNFEDNNFTVAYWVKKLSVSVNWDNTPGVGKWNTGGEPGTNEWTFGLGGQNDDYPHFNIEGGDIKYKATSTTPLTVNQWHHLAGVREGSQLKLYQDGVLVATTDVGTAVINNTSLPIYIGRIGDAGYNSHAVFDELKVFNYALSAAEVGQLANLTANPVLCGEVPNNIELQALRDFYESTGGVDWTNNTGWPTDWGAITSIDQVTGWHGIAVEDGDVIILNLPDNNLSGVLPVSLGQLKGLRTLNLSANAGITVIPAEIGGLTNLETLNLALVGYTTLPSELNNLITLKSLTLDGVNSTVSGPLPDLGNLVNLETLIIRNFNGKLDFSAGFPSWMRSLTQLRVLHLSKTYLSTSLPDWIGELVLLWELDVQYCNISGNLPLSLGNLSVLKKLLINNNSLEGEIPEALGNLQHLEFLYANGNNFSGSVPASLVAAPNITRLYLSGNSFTSLPDFKNLPRYAISTIAVTNNNLGFASIENNMTGVDTHPFSSFTYSPQKESGQQRINYVINTPLKISNDRPGGPNTSYQWQEWDGTQWTDISGATNADLNITAPDGSYSGKKYRCEMVSSWATGFKLYSSEFELEAGVVPDNIELQALRDLYESTGGPSTWLNTTGWPADWTTITSVDQIVGWHGVTTFNGDVVSIDLNNNGLSGMLPASLNDLKALKVLRLYRNNIKGGIPDIRDLKALEELHLSNNALGGTIPAWITGLTALQDLGLETCSLTGEIPDDIGNLVNLDLLSLRVNQLTGDLPASINSLSKLVHLRVDVNKLTGPLPDMRNLSVIQLLDLNRNKFEGQIPEWLGSLRTLKYIRIWNNNFNGPIPVSLGNLDQLEQLHLGYCQLTGTIPQEIVQLPKLKYLYLQVNKLEGELPEVPATSILRDIYLSKNKVAIPTLKNLPGITKLLVDNTWVSFADIENNMPDAGTPQFSTFIYSPQQLVVAPVDLNYFVGQDLTVVNDRAGGVNTLYQWQKWNGSIWEDVVGASTMDLSLPAPGPEEDNQKYRCKMTNTVITDVEIFSSEFILNAVVSKDFYTIADGDWNDSGIWSNTSGGATVNTVPTMYDIVYIEGHDVKVSTEVSCRGMNINALQPGKVEVAGEDAYLIVNGEIMIEGPAERGKKMLVVNNGGKIECR